MLTLHTYLLQQVRHHKWLVLGIVATSLLQSGVFILIPYFSKLQIDELQKVNASLTAFIIFLATPFVIQGINTALIQPLNSLITRKLREKIQIDLAFLIYRKIASLDNSFFDNSSNRRLITIAQSASSSISGYIFQITDMFTSLLNIIAVFPILFLVNSNLLLLILLSSLVQAAITQSRQKSEARYSLLMNKKRDDVWPLEYILGSDFGQFRVVGDPTPMYQKLNSLKLEQLEMTLADSRRSYTFSFLAWFTRDVIDNISRIIIGAGVIAGRYTLGEFTMINTYLGRLSGAFSSVINNIRFMEESRLSLFQLNYFLGLQSHLNFDPNPKSVLPKGKSIVLKNVSFAYPGFKDKEKKYLESMIKRTESFINRFWSWRHSDLAFWQKYLSDNDKATPVIHDLSLEIKPGRLTALLGRNGAGKTTITNLILHNLEPDQGSILYGNQPIKKYSHAAWLPQFSVVQQSPYLSRQFSLRDNLSFGVPNPTDEKIFQMLDKIGLGEHIRKLPKQLDSILGEDTNLSGGQSQLLAICRSLLQNRPFYILDEALSQLDIEKEARLLDLLKTQAKSSGILFITHRITTARKADYIYILDEGKIVEAGTHENLLAKGGLYTHFWHLQTIA